MILNINKKEKTEPDINDLTEDIKLSFIEHKIYYAYKNVLENNIK